MGRKPALRPDRTGAARPICIRLQPGCRRSGPSFSDDAGAPGELVQPRAAPHISDESAVGALREAIRRAIAKVIGAAGIDLKAMGSLLAI